VPPVARGEEVRAEVDPLLVDEETRHRVPQALPLEVAPPPVQERNGATVDRAEAEVVDAHVEQVPLAELAVLAGRREVVRGEQDAALGAGQVDGKLDHRRGHVGVGIEIRRLLGVLQQLEEQQWLHRGRELDEVVDGGQPKHLALGDPEGLRAHHPDARHVGQVLVAEHVDEQHDQLGLGVVPAQAVGERDGLGQVVLSEDRAVDRAGRGGGHWQRVPTAEGVRGGVPEHCQGVFELPRQGA
jgi:hypothetical protein